MGQYKVPQDVEAEDKLLGPLSLRQFIYAIIALMWGALMWQIFKAFLPLAVILTIPVSGIFLALAFGKKEGQTFENYFIALVRFWAMPRKRFWMKDTGTVIIKEPPPPEKKSEEIERDPIAVRGQLQQLALILETQGYLPKDPLVQLPDTSSQAAQLSQRIIGPAQNQSIQTPPPTVTTRATTNETPLTVATTPDAVNPQAVVQSKQDLAPITAKDDLLDLSTSERAATVGEMLENVETKIRAHALEEMQHAMHNKPAARPADSEKRSSSPAVVEAASNDLMTVGQIARRVNQPQTMAEDQVVQIKPE